MADAPKPRVMISHQGCIPIYRRSFFEHLARLGAVEYVVVHGDAPRGSDMLVAEGPFAFPNLKVRNREIRVLGRDVVWQPILLRIIRGEFDAMVVGDELKFLSSVVAAFAMRLRRRPVILWGFGFHLYGLPQTSLKARITAAAAGWFKRRWLGLASGYVVYTPEGVERLARAGMARDRIAVLGNTVDMEKEYRLRDEAARLDPAEAVATLGVRADSVKLLYFGRFRTTKRIDLLIDYARHAAASGRAVDVLVFGAGSTEADLRERAAGLANVRFHRHDDMLLAKALRLSAAVVIPGLVGLAITHGFAHGVPLLTRHGVIHSPEIAYLEEGENGLMLPEAPEGFFAALDAFVDDPALRQRLAEGAARSARLLSMEAMAGSFDALVRARLDMDGVDRRP